jgi:hypothetical protein
MNAVRARAACACGLALPGPWELAAHLLEVIPPKVVTPLDGQRHADMTRLTVKLGSMAPWEIVTWAGSQRKDLRVAAAITCTARAGDLRPGQEILGTEVRSAYGVSMHTARAAIWILEDFGIARKYGPRYNLEDNIEETLHRHRGGTVLDQIARHVAALEDRTTVIEGEISALRRTNQVATGTSTRVARGKLATFD